ncbi:MAG TPA: HDOD domain-containing protein [Dissulfurispiraceae bacterium]|nr:HDOD domain-containing protein [Dissulfurispiraceae bacterium]
MDDIKKKISLDDLQLPGLPDTTVEVITALEDDNCSIQKLEQVILRDPTLTAEILKIANAPLYRTGKSVKTVAETIMVLGMGNLVSLVSIASLANEFSTHEFDRTILRHMLAVSAIAALLAPEVKSTRVRNEFAVVAGLLHDIGKLAMSSGMPGDYGKTLERGLAEQRSFADLEREHFGFTHAEAGALLAERWHFPPLYREVIAAHHNAGVPTEMNEVAALTTLIRIADCLALDAGIGHGTAEVPELQQLIFLLGISAETLETIRPQIDEMKTMKI